MTSTNSEGKQILVINGSYREDGWTDSLVDAALQSLDPEQVDLVNLRDYPIEFCLNCRECMQQPGSAPGQCVHDDAMASLVLRIEAADAYILASPTNMGSVTALFKRFMERLAVYGFWPWGKPAPQYRKDGLAPKKALLITSTAAPSIIGRVVYGSARQLRFTARTIGAKPVGLLFSGLAAEGRDAKPSPRMLAKAQAMTRKLL